jgi:hypothetical protein
LVCRWSFVKERGLLEIQADVIVALGFPVSAAGADVEA